MNKVMVFTIILYYILSCSLSLASSIHEIFDLPIEQILNHPNLNSTINEFLNQCNRVHSTKLFFETSTTTQNDVNVSYKSRCKQANMIDKILRYEDDIKNPSNVFEQYADTGIETRTDEDFSFSDFFLDFEITGKPVKITDLPILLPRSSFLTINDIVNSFQSRRQTQSVDQMFQTIHSIKDFATEDFKVPKYVMNDYFQRISENNTDLFSPRLTIIGTGDVIEPSDATCPNSLHGLYVILNDLESHEADSSDPRVIAKVFDPTSIATILKPKLKINSNVKTSMPKLKINYEEDELWHNENDKRHGHNSTKKTVELFTQSALFVPSKSAVAFQGSESSTEKALMLRFCFADASNIQSVKTSLSFDAMLDDTSITKVLLAQLNDPKFDHTMERIIPSASNYFNSYKIWPRNNVDEIDTTSTSGEIKDASIHRRAQEKEHKPKDRKRRSKSKSFSHWQSEKTWNHKVLSLTLPILSPPDVLSVGRNNVTLRWESSFHKKDGDVSNVGYLIIWEGLTNDKGMKVVGNCTFDEEDDVDHNDIDKNKMMVEYATDSASLSLGQRIKRITALIEGFESNTEYNFQVALTYGTKEINTQSPISPKSKTVQTLKPQKPSPLSSPPYIISHSLTDSETSVSSHPTSSIVLLEFRAPYDDGGMKILGYDVIKSNLDSYGHKVGEWVLLQHGVEELNDSSMKVEGGQLVRIAIHNLLPGGSYSFKVAARNNLGRSEWSSASEVIVTRKQLANYYNNENTMKCRRLKSVKGRHSGDSNMMIIHGVGSNSLNTPSNHKALSTIVKLNDAEQTMGVVGLADDIEIWSSYWSPKGFVVHAEACFINRSSVDDLANDIITSDVEYRIAFIQRGNYNDHGKRKRHRSLAHRSLALQRGGALAVVIMDDEGENKRCEKFDQYCMLGSSKEDGDNWGEYELFRVWKDIKIPVVLVGTIGSSWKSIVFD